MDLLRYFDPEKADRYLEHLVASYPNRSKRSVTVSRRSLRRVGGFGSWYEMRDTVAALEAAGLLTVEERSRRNTWYHFNLVKVRSYLTRRTARRGWRHSGSTAAKPRHRSPP